MTTEETFEWLRQRSQKLDEVLAENERLTQQVVDLALENAWLSTAKQREQEARAQQIDAELLNITLI